MKKTIFIVLTLFVLNIFSGCVYKQKEFDLNQFGFENNNGMHIWLEITEYDFETRSAQYSKEYSSPYMLDFKEHVLISYTSADSSKPTLQSFEVLDNDTAKIDGEPIYITERILKDNMLVIKVIRKNSESMFVLKEMTEAVADNNLRYNFKIKNLQ